MKKYTYTFNVSTCEYSEKYHFTSNKKYSQDDLKQILHTVIIKYVKENEKITDLDWEYLFDTLYETNPVITMLDEEYDLTLYTPTSDAQLNIWGWSHVSSDGFDSFDYKTSDWQSEINNEVFEIIKDRSRKEYTCFIGR